MGSGGTPRRGGWAESRRKSHVPVRDGTGEDHTKRISRPPRSSALTPLRRDPEAPETAGGTTTAQAAHTGGARPKPAAPVLGHDGGGNTIGASSPRINSAR
jgi:hypothetical protein